MRFLCHSGLAVGVVMAAMAAGSANAAEPRPSSQQGKTAPSAGFELRSAESTAKFASSSLARARKDLEALRMPEAQQISDYFAEAQRSIEQARVLAEQTRTRQPATKGSWSVSGSESFSSSRELTGWILLYAFAAPFILMGVIICTAVRCVRRRRRGRDQPSSVITPSA